MNSGGNPFQYVFWYEVHRSNLVNVAATPLINGFNSGWVPCLGATRILHCVSGGIVTAVTNLNFNDAGAFFSMEKSTTNAAVANAASGGYTFLGINSTIQELNASCTNTHTRIGNFSTTSGSPIITAVDQAALDIARAVSLRCSNDSSTQGLYGARVSGSGIAADSNLIARDPVTLALTMRVNATATASPVSLTFNERLGGPIYNVLAPLPGGANTYGHQHIHYRFYRASLLLTGTSITNVRCLLGVCYDAHPSPYQLATGHTDPCGTTLGPVEFSNDTGVFG